MTISEANAANEIAREVITMAAEGAGVSPALEHGVAILLINAHKVLSAGHDTHSFIAALTKARKESRDRHKQLRRATGEAA